MEFFGYWDKPGFEIAITDTTGAFFLYPGGSATWQMAQHFLLEFSGFTE